MTGNVERSHRAAVAIVALLAIVVGEVGTRAAESALAGKRPSKEKRLAQWRNARFGMFIHWGPVSLKGTEIGWSRARSAC